MHQVCIRALSQLVRINDMLWWGFLQAMLKLFDPVLTWAARRYQAAVATELKKYGLRYEDLYDPQLNMVWNAHCQQQCTTGLSVL